MKPELVGIAIRQAENWSDDVEARKAVGRLIDDIKALGGAENMIEGESAVAKVKTLILTFLPIFDFKNPTNPFRDT